MAKNNPRTKFLSNKKQKARKLGIDVSDIKISNKLTDGELKALDTKLNKLIRSVNPNYSPKANPVYTPPSAPKKPRREKRADSASNLLKEYKRKSEEFINSIPKELMEHEAIKKFFTKGEYIVNARKIYDLHTKGYTLLHFNSVKDFKEHYGTTSQKKLERMLKNEIKQLENNMYESLLKDRIIQIEKSLDKFKNDNQELSAVFEEKFKKEIREMNLFQLIEITNMLEKIDNNVFDSIYESKEKVSDEPFEKTIDAILHLGQKANLTDYGN